MPNNEEENKESLAKSQANLQRMTETLVTVSAQIAEQQAILAKREAAVSAKEAEAEVIRAQLESGRTDLMNGRQAVAASLAENQELVAETRAILAELRAEKGEMIPLVKEMILSNQDVVTQSKSAMDFWSRSVQTIEKNTGNVASQIETVIEVFNAGFELMGKKLDDNYLLTQAVETATVANGARQEGAVESMHRRFNELDLNVNAVRANTDKIGEMLNHMSDLMTSILARLDAQKKQLDDLRTQGNELVELVTDTAFITLQKMTTQLSTFTQIPEKMQEGIKAFNASAAKIRGMVIGAEAKLSEVTGNLGVKIESMSETVMSVKDMGNSLVNNAKNNFGRAVEGGIADMQESMIKWIKSVITEGDDLYKKSEIYGMLGQLHGVSEEVKHAMSIIAEAIEEGRDFAEELNGSIKREGVELQENVSFKMKSVVASYDSIEKTIHNTNLITSDATARLDNMSGLMTSLNTKLTTTVGTSEAILSLASTQATYTAKEIVEAFCDRLDAMPDQITKLVMSSVSDKITEVTNAAVAKYMGADQTDDDQ